MGFACPFYGVKAAAANLGKTQENYTAAMFQEDFPQFFTPDSEETPASGLVPPAMLEQLTTMAGQSIQPDKWLGFWRYACGLYTAHYASLYLRTYSQGSQTPAQAAASGALVGVVSSAKLGADSVSYDTGSLTKATEGWGNLNATQYGQLLATLARMVGMGGTLVW